MAVFKYDAIAANGRKVTNKIEAPGLDAARNSLRKAGYTVLTIKELGAAQQDIEISFLGKPKPKDLALFCRQIVSVLRAGVPASQALAMVGQSTENKKLTAAIRTMQADVEKGYSLAAATRKHVKMFGKLLPNMVAAGEESGNLETAFTQMAAYYEKTTKTRNAVSRVMIYPIILIIVMIGVLILMMTRIIPNFMKTFEEIGAELPGITLAVMAFSRFFVKWWWLILIGLAVLTVGLILFNKTDPGRHFFGWLARKLPALGNFTVKSACALMSRTMAQLLGAGVPLTESLTLVAGNMKNIYFREALMKTQGMVIEGYSMSAALRNTGIFPSMLYNMVAVGEETGDMEEMLGKVADFYDEEVETATQKLLAMIEPVITIFMAVLVLILVLAIFLPTLNMTKAYDQYL